MTRRTCMGANVGASVYCDKRDVRCPLALIEHRSQCLRNLPPDIAGLTATKPSPWVDAQYRSGQESVMIHRQCRKLMWRLDVLTHCRIRWVCNAADRTMLR